MWATTLCNRLSVISSVRNYFFFTLTVIIADKVSLTKCFQENMKCIAKYWRHGQIQSIDNVNWHRLAVSCLRCGGPLHHFTNGAARGTCSWHSCCCHSSSTCCRWDPAKSICSNCRWPRRKLGSLRTLNRVCGSSIHLNYHDSSLIPRTRRDTVPKNALLTSLSSTSFPSYRREP